MSQERLINGARASALSQLTRGFAHQTKNDLFAAVGLAGILLEMTEDEFVKPRLQMIHDSGFNIQQRALALTEFARPALEQTETADLVEVAKEAVALLRKIALGADIELNEEYTSSDATVTGSHYDLVSAFVLMLLNAQQALPAGGTIWVKVERCSDNCVRGFIEDSGNGIPEQHLQNIFDPFFSTKPGHLGLGLTIVQAVAKRNGGEINVDSDSSGADFCFTLPAAVPAAQDASAGDSGSQARA